MPIRKTYGYGLRDGPLTPIAGNPVFYFRVRVKCNDGHVRQFDCATVHHSTIQAAHHSLASVYPGAIISALSETDFDTDGLPRVRLLTNQREPKQRANVREY